MLIEDAGGMSPANIIVKGEHHMKKRLLSVLLALTFIMASAVVAFPASAAVITDAEFVAPEILIPETIRVPDNDLITNNQEFYLAEGTRWQQKVTTDFLAEGKKGRGTYNQQKYIVVHNTGAYPASSTALSNHNYGKNTDAEVSWHYTCGNDGIYQMIPVNEKGWHAGGNYWGTSDVNTKLEMGWVQDASNSTGIGIETATPGFPAEQTSAGELWDSDEMYEWYENTFDKTATYLAELVAYICVSLNFNPYTQIVQHYSTAAKNCPIQMRYVFGSNGKTFTFYGTYFKVFLDRMYDYYKAMGGSYVETDTTIKNVYYNPNKLVYKTGYYTGSSKINVYRAGNAVTELVGTVEAGEKVNVEVVGWNWGKVTLADGTKGWISLGNLTYAGEGYDLGTYRNASGDILNVTAINGTTATYEGGTADITTLTRVYKVTVKNSDTFGTETKYYAKGETFEVTANAPTGAFLFDLWEVTNGSASIADRYALTTTITVLDTDMDLTASYRDTYDLSVGSGSGSGRYKAGEVVSIKARNMPGKAFTKWTIDGGSGTFADANAAETTFTMGSADTEITAHYEDMGELDISEYTNVGLGAKYTTVWKGSTDIQYYGVSKDTNLTLFTDGTLASGGFTDNPKNFVAFQGTGGKGEVTFDLGSSKEISAVVLRDVSLHGGSWLGIKEGSLVVSVSTDGSTFTEVTNLVDTIYFSTPGGVKDTTLQTHLGTFDAATARYVKVDFTSEAYCLGLTEIEILSKNGGICPEPDGLTGDANGDDLVDNTDASLILKYDAGIDAVLNLDVADVDGDELVDNTDASLILKYDAGIIDSL